MKSSEVYREYLDVKFNQEYYGRRLARAKALNKTIDIFLALFAGGSGIAAFGIWQVKLGSVEAGKILFSMLAGVGLVLGITRPIVKLDDEIERLSGIQSAYSSLAFQLDDLVRSIEEENSNDRFDVGRFETLRAIRGAQDAKEDRPQKGKLAQKCQEAVRARHAKKVARLKNHEANRN